MTPGEKPSLSLIGNFEDLRNPVAVQTTFEQFREAQAKLLTAYDAANRVPAGVVKGFLNAIGVERVSRVGNSMGGYFAFAFALVYPRRVHKIVAIGAAGKLRPELLHCARIGALLPGAV